MKKKEKSVLLALKKIARSTGEEEDDEIFTLEREFNIKITEDEVSTLRDVLINESVWIWVLKPYSEREYELEKEKLRFIERSLSVEKFVKKIRLRGRFFIKYLESITLSRVHDSIFEELLNEHVIADYNVTESEWEDILTSKQFKKAEIQVAREFIASKLSKKKCESPPSVNFLESQDEQKICWFCQIKGRASVGSIFNSLGYGYVIFFCKECLTEILVDKVRAKSIEDDN